ncbi:hypothetical protein C8R44DRAFT_733859 [Mycena epipterygia]|nr:hypothetical protein C8R44DRAFT_733859 [Mycena epipterygia]
MFTDRKIMLMGIEIVQLKHWFGIAQLKVRFSGVLVQPVLQLNGAITPIIPHPVSSDYSDGAAVGKTTCNGKGDLLDEVDKSLEKNSATDQDEDGPDWMFKEGEKELVDPTYSHSMVLARETKYKNPEESDGFWPTEANQCETSFSPSSVLANLQIMYEKYKTLRMSSHESYLVIFQFFP